MPALNGGSPVFRRADTSRPPHDDGELPRDPAPKLKPEPHGFPPVLWAVTVLGILFLFLILRKVSSLKGVVAYGLKTVAGGPKQEGGIRLPDDAPDSTATAPRPPRSARLDVPVGGVPARRFSISEDPESDTTSSDVDARNSYESERRREFAGRVPPPRNHVQ